MSRPEPEVQVSDTPDALARATADAALRSLAGALDARGVAHLVITGGGILEQVLAALAQPGDGTVDWRRVHVWWGDERYVPHDSDDRNDLPATAKLLDHVDVETANVHRMPASDAGFDDAEDAARAYAAELAGFGGDGAATPAFDVALIGLGPDGHCCSLFPHHPVLQVSDTFVSAVHDSPKPPPDRLTLTFSALAAAREIWFVASGDGKADAVRAALSGTATVEDTPSSRPRGTERTRWLLDRDAAGELPG